MLCLEYYGIQKTFKDDLKSSTQNSEILEPLATSVENNRYQRCCRRMLMTYLYYAGHTVCFRSRWRPGETNPFFSHRAMTFHPRSKFLWHLPTYTGYRSSLYPCRITSRDRHKPNISSPQTISFVYVSHTTSTLLQLETKTSYKGWA